MLTDHGRNISLTQDWRPLEWKRNSCNSTYENSSFDARKELQSWHNLCVSSLQGSYPARASSSQMSDSKCTQHCRMWGHLTCLLSLDVTNTGEATPRGPQTIPISRTQNQGTRSSLLKTTSARQKALAKLKRADRNVLDASQC